jgi:AraC-like DNA-binding protein
MEEIFDEYYWAKDIKLITYEQHKVTGLKNIAHYNLLKTFPPVSTHYHSNIVEFHCLTKGRRIANVGNKNYTITGGECFITFPFEPHSTGNYPLNPCEFYSFQIDVKAKRLLGLNQELSDYLANQLQNLPHRHYKLNYNDLQNLKASFDCIALGGIDNTYLSLQYFNCFLFNVKILEPIYAEKRPQINPNIQKSLDYIELNYKDAIPLSVLANISSYSLSSFKVKFKDIIGITPAEYITLRKIEYAKTVLSEPNQSVTKLAFDLGFSSSNYFCSVFKKYTNIAPSQYYKLK